MSEGFVYRNIGIKWSMKGFIVYILLVAAMGTYQGSVRRILQWQRKRNPNSTNKGSESRWRNNDTIELNANKSANNMPSNDINSKSPIDNQFMHKGVKVTDFIGWW